MNEALKMQISAFIDGELPENEAELLLRRLNQDAAMRQQVAEYLCIGRWIRRDPEVKGMSELRGRIASALGEERVPSTQTSVEPGSRYYKPAMGFALAASVAILAVVGLRQAVLPDAGEAVTQTGVPVSETVPAVTQAANDDALPEELRHMYLRHSASAADFGTNGIITRLVALELQGGELVRIDRAGTAADSATIDSMAPAAEPPDEQPGNDTTQVD